MECINTLPAHVEIPFRTVIDRYKKNIYFVRRCFRNIENENMERYCNFICGSFTFGKLSKVLDGDLKMLYTLYTYILDFTRVNHMPYDNKLILSRKYLESLDSLLYKPRQIKNMDFL